MPEVPSRYVSPEGPNPVLLYVVRNIVVASMVVMFVTALTVLPHTIQFILTAM
ncbi:MAG: hypothetical protein HQL51_02565 [Magnetococcales bacterium]|nr:hypothetical protein [Magnetococcales bacterium]